MTATVTGAAPGEVRAITAAVLGAVAATLPVFLVGPLAPAIRADLGFDRARLGLAIGLCQATAATSAWALGRRVVTLGPARATRLGVGLSAVSLVAIGLVADSWAALVACLVFCGLGSAVAQPATNAVLMSAVVAPRRGRAFGIKLAAIPLASLIAGLSVPLVGDPFGWRAAFLVAAVIPVVAALAIPATAAVRPADRHADPPATDTPLRSLALLGAAAGLTIGAANSVPSFYVESATDNGLASGTAGVLLAVGSLSGVVARIAAGRRVDRRRRADLRSVSAMILVGSLGFFFLTRHDMWAQATGVVLTFALGWGWVGVFQYVVVTVNRSNPGAATGLTDTGGYLGAFAGPIALGAIAQASSFDLAWTVAGAAAMTGSALVALGARTAQRSGRPLEVREAPGPDARDPDAQDPDGPDPVP
jgi:MFS family permease